jgi:hypothetical protein
MKTIKEVMTFAGLIILLIFLTGCTGNASSTSGNNAGAGHVIVGPSPTPIPHTIVGTWKVDYNGHTGTIKFKPDSYMDIDVSGYPGASIYYTGANNIYYASYFTYSAQFKYNPESDTITSDQYQGVTLKRAL